MISDFTMGFLLADAVIAVLIVIILFLKKALKAHISKRIQYNIWFLLLLALAVPFLPVRQEGFLHAVNLAGVLKEALPAKGNAEMGAGKDVSGAAGTGWMQDFSVSVKGERIPFFSMVLFVLWLGGMAVIAGVTLSSGRKMRQLARSALPVQDQEINALFEECKKELGIGRKVKIYSSAYVRSPVAFGLFRPSILLPIRVIGEFERKDIRYILLHELMHYRYWDIPVNYWVCLTRILYWFHPFVWYALKEMRTDREIACDAAVLAVLRQEDYTDYGNTLIQFAEKLSAASFSAASAMGGTKKQLKKRIISIAGFRPEGGWLKLKSGLVLSAAVLIVLLFLPGLMANAKGGEAPIPVANETREDLGTYFGDYKGSFVLYDQKRQAYTIYNEKGSAKRVSPDSTYKIYSALFALENKVITPDSSQLDWDKTQYSFAAWNRDQDLDSAMENSVNWYFKTLDAESGLASLEKDFHKIGYGNEDLSGGISSYWMESSLKISPLEQVRLLNSFCQNDFHFDEKNVEAVKKSLWLSGSGTNALYGKTGTGAVDGKNVNGWFIGFIETGDNTYTFALNINKEDSCKGSTAAKIALTILESMGIDVPR